MASRLPERLTALLDRPAAERKIGAFRLKQQLGRGGFAPVWLADEVAGSTTLRQAAIKLFAVDERLGAQARQDVIAEAERLCLVEHPNIVRFYALPVDEESGVVGLAMEYVGGESIAERLRAVTRLSVSEAVDVGIAVASALVAVHAVGLVHRDIWPANVIENPALRGSPAAYKLIDFGIAVASVRGPPAKGAGQDAAAPRASRPSQPSLLAAPEAWLGKRGYVDPVCWRDLSPATMASDLYALGALLFVCLSGKIPAAAFGSLDDDVLVGKRSPPRLSELRPDLPPRLAALVSELLAAEPEHRPGSAEIVALELERIRVDLSRRSRSLPAEEEGPFRGLSRFEREHRDVFFGRRVEVAVALEVLRTRGLLALVGPSGSGKSSLSRAGILPALEDGALGGPRRWEVIVVSPGTDPRQALTEALRPMGLTASLGAAEAASRVEAWLAESQRGLVLLVDQLEELATLEEASDKLGESRRFAMDLLARLGERARPGLRVIVTARRDMLDPILKHRELGRALMRGTVLVSPLGSAEWGRVIDAALESYGYSFEDPDLRDELLQAIAPCADAMPLVEFALAELWQARDRDKKQISRAGWVGLRGIAGALHQHAEATLYPGGAPAVSEVALKHVLRELTTPSGARAPKTLAALTSGGRDAARAEAVRLLRGARLVNCEGPEGKEVVTLSHEIVLSHWGRLAAWVAADKEHRLLLEDLERVAQIWDQKPDSELLFRRRRILLVGEALAQQGRSLEGPVRRFYQASRAAARKSRIAAASLLLAIGIMTAGLLYQKWAREKQRAEDAELRAELDAARRSEAEAKRSEAEAKRSEAEAKLARAEAEEYAYKLAFQLDEVLKHQSHEPGGAARGPSPIDPQLLRDIEAYMLSRQQQHEGVPEPLANVIPEAVAQEATPEGEADAGQPEGDAGPALATAEPGQASPPPSDVAAVDARAMPATRTVPPGALYAALWNRTSTACEKEDGPRGTGKVALVLEPSGKVSNVGMDARFAGTSVGKCVDAAFRRVTVPPFEGKPMTIFWSFTIR